MAKKANKPPKPKARPRCGIVMPISAMPDCPKAHWGDVLDIIREALEGTFSINLVSDADETRVIQGRIVQSLYDDPIVVCDVSCRNSNVMFELGMRIALDKPVVVIKDDVTDFSFDYSPLAHLMYPRSLAHKEICAFKLRLASTVAATLAESKKPDYQSFLKTFAPRVVAGRLEVKKVSETQYLAEKLDQILAGVNRSNSWNASAARDVDLAGASKFRAGERVVIKDGALKGLEGVILSIRPDGRLTIGVRFLQQGSSVSVSDSQVELAEPLGPGDDIRAVSAVGKWFLAKHKRPPKDSGEMLDYFDRLKIGRQLTLAKKTGLTRGQVERALIAAADGP